MAEKSVEILLVEDNPADASLTLTALRDARSPNEVHVVTDGEEALAFLKRDGSHVSAPRPDLVFLDLSLPKVDGYQVLEAMKADPVLRRIPVVAISGSSREIDIARAYDGQISAYLVKPRGVDEYFAAIRSLKELWFHAAAPPPREEAPSTYAGKGKVILVVDDDRQTLARTQQILTEAGYRVLSASSAEEAEALADTDAVFDLIICSVVMDVRGESGVHLAEHIERSKRTNSTLLVSHYSRDLLRHVPGFDRQRHFLSNPFSVEELLTRVRDLLAG